MRKSKNSCIFYFLGTLAGALIGLLIVRQYIIIDFSGENVKWSSMGNPGSEITHIIIPTRNAVFVETTKGSFYEGTLGCDSCWEKISDPSLIPVAIENPIDSVQIGSQCQPKYYKMQEPPFKSVLCASYFVGFETSFEVHYALLEDGNIWSWEHNSTKGGGGVYYIEKFFRYTLGTGIGIVIGFGFSFVLLLLSQRINNQADRK